MSARGGTLTDVPARPDPCDHEVTFYESDGYLVQSTAAFLSEALAAGRPAIAVATREHLDAIRAALAVRAAHPAGGPHPGQLVMLDAHETLDRFMVDGAPDPAAFEAVIGELIDRLAPTGDPRIFGEMVAVLWEKGDLTGALALEDLWNELARSRSFGLSCGYPIRSFDTDEDAAAFREVCRRHSAVAPGESYSYLRDADARSRRTVELQRETAAGVNERQTLQRTREQLESTVEHLRGLDRLRTEFVAMVAHDIRGPATMVSASLELLQEAGDLDDDEAGDLLANAAEGARSVQRLADDMLTMSRIDAGEFDFELRPLDPADVVARAVRQVRATTGRPVEIEQPARRPRVLVDADRQAQILSNLLSNAVKFSPDGSPVRVGIETGDQHVRISVSDEGCGIAEEDQVKLFRPFSRVTDHPPRSGGTGLGLSIAKALVEGQGGTIDLDSRPGHGTTVSYTILVAPDS